MKRVGLFLVLAAILLLALSSCRRAEFSGGHALSDEETQLLLGSLQEEPCEDETEQDEKLYYFVMGSGAVYHTDPSCGYLKNSKSVQAGTLSQVLAAGKERLCEACAKKEGAQASANGADAERACYYTVGGSVWHYDAACSSLAHSDNVQSGTVEQAMLDGKTRACARCGNQ